MPNGGNDCCGTCCFNAEKKGKTGYENAYGFKPGFCIIRQLKIEVPFYTYCANHSFRNSQQLNIPVGPVWTADEGGKRKIWQPSPDTEEIRQGLLRLLSQIQELPEEVYSIGIHREEMIIRQLGELREPRALKDLERIAGFQPSGSAGRYGRERNAIINLALEAIAKIKPGRQ